MDVKAFATAGSVWTQTYTLAQYPGGPPIDLTGLVFELVIRPSTTDATNPPLVKVTSAGSTSQGSVTITPGTGTVVVALTPAATLLLGRSTNPYGLWSSPGTTAATEWVSGTFVTSLAAQP